MAVFLIIFGAVLAGFGGAAFWLGTQSRSDKRRRRSDATDVGLAAAIFVAIHKLVDSVTTLMLAWTGMKPTQQRAFGGLLFVLAGVGLMLVGASLL